VNRSLVVSCALTWLCACSEPRSTIIQAKGRLEVETAALDFGEVALGDRKTGTIVLRNAGGDELNLCLPRLADEGCTVPSHLDPADQRFEWPLRDMRWSLRPSESLPFTVAFEPDRPGAFVSSLVIGHDGENGPELAISLTGGGVTPDIRFSETTFDFGAVPLSGVATRTLTIENLTTPQSTVTLTVRAVGTSTAFEVRSGGADLLAQGTLNVPPGAQMNIDLRFVPLEERAFQQQLEIAYCPGCSQTISMSGVGVAPRIDVFPAEISFAQHEDRAPISAMFDLRSTGTGTLTVLGFEVRDGPAEEFNVVTGGLPLVLPPGTSAEIEVEHLGRVPGVDLATLVVLSDAWMEPETTLSLLAESTGPNIEVVPNALDFGAVRPGATAQRTVVVQNTGNRPLTISGMQVTPAGDLTVAPPVLPAVLGPGERLLVPITFAPLVEGTFSAMLLIASDDADQATLLVPVGGIGGDPEGCSLSATPSAIDLGQRERGLTSAHRVELRNVGTQACTLTNPVITGDAGFSLAAGIPAQIEIDPGESAAIPFEFFPAAYGAFQAVLEVSTDDPTQPKATVPLAAASQASTSRVAPLSIDFGPVNPSCRSGARSISVHAYGAQAIVEAIELDPTSSQEFELGVVALPATVNANQSFSVPIYYRPTAEGEDFGILHVTVGGNRSSVPLYGEGTSDDDIDVRMTQAYVPRSDVLFVVNNTNGTGAERQRLAQAIGGFFTLGQSQGIDFRVAMTSMEIGFGDRGVFLAEPPQSEKVITPQSVDPVGAFSSNISENGGGNTGGIQASFLALTDPLINADNAGFLRPDGLLTVVYVTDEDDQSVGDLLAYERHLGELKAARGGRFQAVSIVDSDPNDCQSTFGSGEYSPTYLALVERTGGINSSFCADWNTSVAAISPYAFGKTRRFPVRGAPVSTSIEVRVDNGVVPRTDAQGVVQWTYSDQSRAVVFSETAVPDFGEEVRISYALECL
jgi:hypothetical protein